MNRVSLEKIAYKIKTIHKLSMKHMERQVPNLTPEQVELLCVLKEGSMNQKDMAKRLHISEATLSVRIKRLVDSGYLVKETSLEDKRYSTVKLSEIGEKEWENLESAFNNTKKLVTEVISDEELVMIDEVVNRVRQHLEDALNNKQ